MEVWFLSQAREDKERERLAKEKAEKERQEEEKRKAKAAKEAEERAQREAEERVSVRVVGLQRSLSNASSKLLSACCFAELRQVLCFR